MTAGSRARIFFYVQHLLGIGHVFRASRVARSLAGRGFDVKVVWGGTRLPMIELDGIETIYLEPLRAADSAISALVTADGTPASASLLADRRDKLLTIFQEMRPDILLTETFPFGRRQMQFELVPLLQNAIGAKRRPMIVSSIRDIMTEHRREKRARESIDWARDWYDLVLVHGDPSLVRIEKTLKYANEIADKLRYTGIVAPEVPDPSVAPSIRADVVVSAGGGAVGHALTSAAITANSYCRSLPGRWLLVVGPERPAAEFDHLRSAAGPGMQVVQFVPDLMHILAAAQVSVSRAGYNTVADIMRANCRSVLCPFEGGRETEQLRRARTLERNGFATMIRDGELTPQSIAAAVDKAVDSSPLRPDIDLDGADKSAEIVMTEFCRFRDQAQ